MQVMPATAISLGIKNVSDPNESIRGGATYLNQIYGQFIQVTDSLNRIKLTMASYNCGLGHVLDAQLLAEKNGLDPNIWTDNVESMLLDLSLPKNYNKSFIKYGYVRGSEPVMYVDKVFERYEQYKTFIKLE